MYDKSIIPSGGSGPSSSQAEADANKDIKTTDEFMSDTGKAVDGAYPGFDTAQQLTEKSRVGNGYEDGR